MKQNKLESFIEAIVNTFVGFVITMTIYPLVNWICGINMTIGQASLSTLLFTIVSIARGYVIRRFFNNMYSLKHGIALWFSQLWINIKVIYVRVAVHYFAQVTLMDSVTYGNMILWHFNVKWKDYSINYNVVQGESYDLRKKFSDQITSEIIDKHYNIF